jgi:hypothetical protein
MQFSVDPFDVLLPLLRGGLGASYKVRSKTPDQVSASLPLVVVRQTGGSSFAPDFWDQPYISITNWAAPAGGEDAVRVARLDADRIRDVLWTAWRQQTTVPGVGHLTWVRESQGPLEINDPDLPQLGCFTATYEIRIRRALSA